MKNAESRILTKEAASSILNNVRHFADMRIKVVQIDAKKFKLTMSRGNWSYFQLNPEDYA